MPKPLETVFGSVCGLQFPTMTQQDQGFAILNMLKGEPDDTYTWRVGFYSFAADLLQIEEWVQTCVASRTLYPVEN